MLRRPALLAAFVLGLCVVLLGAWLLLRPVDPAGTAVPAPITVLERLPSTATPVPSVPAPTTTPTDVVPPPPLDDDDGTDDDGTDDDDDDGTDDDDDGTDDGPDSDRDD